MALEKFGQYVLLEVRDAGGAVILSTDSLRVDFDVRNIKGFSTGKFTIYNLSPSTIKSLFHGENYVTISTRLHGGSLRVIAKDMFISNTLDEIKVPDGVTMLFAYSRLRKDFLEKHISVPIEQSRGVSLERSIDLIKIAAGHTGRINYINFPPEKLTFIPPGAEKNGVKLEGTVGAVFKGLGYIHGFNIYTDDTFIDMICKPEASNLPDTDLFKSDNVIRLDTRNMRATPKVGPAQLGVKSNLDPNIKPGSVLDVTDLLTISTSVDSDVLEVANSVLKNKVAGFSKYLALSVQHQGSNWADSWQTNVSATSPSPGTEMSTDKWWITGY